MSAQTQSSEQEVSVQKPKEVPTEDVVAKYKRLLSLARSSLEANQATLATKDQQLHQLVAALEEEKRRQSSRRALSKEEEAALVPRRVLCRVEVEDVVWILIEYEDYDDTWKSFPDNQALDDFIQRVPGIPLTLPTKCLTAEESHLIIEESRLKVERIVEEFRRYKVRTEIARKQKDAEARQALNGAMGTTAASGGIGAGTPFEGSAGSRKLYGPGGSGHKESPFERAFAQGSEGRELNGRLAAAVEDLHSSASAQHQQEAHAQHQHEEVDRLRRILKEQEQRWQESYEKVRRENEQLRTEGGESVLASQWRARYEHCMREKEDLTKKLHVLTDLTGEQAAEEGSKSLEEAYIDLMDEFKDFRKKVLAIEKRRRVLDGGASSSSVPVSALTGSYNRSRTAAASPGEGRSAAAPAPASIPGIDEAVPCPSTPLSRRSDDASLDAHEGLPTRSGREKAGSGNSWDASSSAGHAHGHSHGHGHGHGDDLVSLVREVEAKLDAKSSTSKVYRRQYGGISGGGHGGFGSLSLFDTSSALSSTGGGNRVSRRWAYNGGGYSPGAGGGNDGVYGDAAGGVTDPKLKYIRGMVFRYLSCKDPEVKMHIETALMAMFRLSEEEKKVIEISRQEDTQDTIASITNFLGETIATFAP